MKEKIAQTARHNRFKDAPWYLEKDEARITPVMIGGAGGIGSWLTLFLARAGFKPHVYDFDMLEEHNIGGQLYPVSLIGKPKVDALKKIVLDLSGETIYSSTEKISEYSATNMYVFSAFDNMEARRIMFKKWADTYVAKDSPSKNPDAIFIDGRLT